MNLLDFVTLIHIFFLIYSLRLKTYAFKTDLLHIYLCININLGRKKSLSLKTIKKNLCKNIHLNCIDRKIDLKKMSAC